MSAEAIDRGPPLTPPFGSAFPSASHKNAKNTRCLGGRMISTTMRAMGLPRYTPATSSGNRAVMWTATTPKPDHRGRACCWQQPGESRPCGIGSPRRFACVRSCTHRTSHTCGRHRGCRSTQDNRMRHTGGTECRPTQCQRPSTKPGALLHVSEPLVSLFRARTVARHSVVDPRTYGACSSPRTRRRIASNTVIRSVSSSAPASDCS